MGSAAIAGAGQVDDSCTLAYVKIPGGSWGGTLSPVASRLCGGSFGPASSQQGGVYTSINKVIDGINTLTRTFGTAPFGISIYHLQKSFDLIKQTIILTKN